MSSNCGKHLYSVPFRKFRQKYTKGHDTDAFLLLLYVLVINLYIS